mmetsp:Transcript_1483/g.3545  ORF Transcript_1483/g.3545 Transcript_1483/m.3545 type:complete len:262 (+) Transcript_1483:130-915(+)
MTSYGTTALRALSMYESSDDEGESLGAAATSETTVLRDLMSIYESSDDEGAHEDFPHLLNEKNRGDEDHGGQVFTHLTTGADAAVANSICGATALQYLSISDESIVGNTMLKNDPSGSSPEGGLSFNRSGSFSDNAMLAELSGIVQAIDEQDNGSIDAGCMPDVDESGADSCILGILQHDGLPLSLEETRDDSSQKMVEVVDERSAALPLLLEETPDEATTLIEAMTSFPGPIHLYLSHLIGPASLPSQLALRSTLLSVSK